MSFYRVIVPIFAALFVSAPAFAQYLLEEKSCADLVRDYAIESPDRRQSQSLREAPITIMLSESQVSNSPYTPEDPIALVEDWDNGVLHLQHKYEPLPNGQVLNCAEIVVEFRLGEAISEGRRGESLQARDSSGHPTEAKLRILALDLVSSEEEAENSFSRWEESDYRISVKFDPISNLESVLLPSTFTGIMNLFPAKLEGDEEHILAIPYDENSPSTRHGNSLLIQRLLVMCSETCSEIYQTVADNRPAGSEGPVMANPVGTTNPESSRYHSFIVEAATLKNGSHSARGFTNEKLDCLIHALAPDAGIFFNPPDCDSDLVRAIRESDDPISIRLDEDRWIFGIHLSEVPLEKIAVTLPPGFSDTFCRIQVSVGPSDAPTDLSLEYIPRSDPAKYESRENLEIKPIDGKMIVRIKPSGEAECGGPSREVTLPASADLTVPLVEDAQAKAAFVHLFIPDTGANERLLEADPATNLALAEGFIQAALLAHHRLAVTNNASLIRIHESHGISLSQNGPTTVFKLGSDQIRNSNVALQSLEAKANELSRNSFPFNQTEIIRYIRSIAVEARSNGFGSLEVLVAGGVLPNDSTVQAAPCAPSAFDNIRLGIGEIEGIDLDVHILPIVKLEPGQVPDLDVQQPLTFSANATGQPGGLFRCKEGADDPLSVYPFYIESWRETRDAIPRLTAAMTDQAAVLLQEYVE